MALHQRDTLKKVLNMAKIEDVKKASQRLAFRSGAENVFDLMGPLKAAFQRQGVDLPLGPHDPMDTMQH